MAGNPDNSYPNNPNNPNNSYPNNVYPGFTPESDNRLNTQPNYYNQPQAPYPPPTHQQTAGSMCPMCNKMTNSYPKKDIGNITWIWCFVLLICTGVCCWIPFVCDSCKEDQIKCAQCHSKKAVL